MRLKKYLLIVLPVLCLAAAAAQAASGRLYFAGYLGLNTYSDAEFSESSAPASGDIELKNAMSFGGALGLRLTPQWRVEAEASYRSGDLDRIDIDGAGSFKLGGDLDTWLWMLNLYYDFDFEWDFLQPYVTAGVGLAGHDASVDDISGFAADAEDDSLNLAWQLGGGLKYNIGDDMALTGDYRYIGSTDPEFGGYEFDFGAHEFRLGLQYALPFGEGH